MAVATIRARKGADGSLRYTAQLRIRNNGAQVYQDSPTFSPKQAAQVWAQRLELYPFGLIPPRGLIIAPYGSVPLCNSKTA